MHTVIYNSGYYASLLLISNRDKSNHNHFFYTTNLFCSYAVILRNVSEVSKDVQQIAWHHLLYKTKSLNQAVSLTESEPNYFLFLRRLWTMLWCKLSITVVEVVSSWRVLNFFETNFFLVFHFFKLLLLFVTAVTYTSHEVGPHRGCMPADDAKLNFTSSSIYSCLLVARFHTWDVCRRYLGRKRNKQATTTTTLVKGNRALLVYRFLFCFFFRKSFLRIYRAHFVRLQSTLACLILSS